MKELGFLIQHDVAGRLSIADLFRKSKKRCGIYMLEFSDGIFYIGQAIDVVRRFGQHRKYYGNIVKIGFMPVRKVDLNDVERDLIYRAEKLNIPITNVVHASNVIGETDLDVLFSPEEQEEWKLNPLKFAEENIRVSDERQRIRYKRKFQDFEKDPRFNDITASLKDYVPQCVPAYRRTEMAFWSLSCLPSTGRSKGFQRLICLNIHWMEILVIGYFKDTPNKIQTFINISETVFRRKYRKAITFRLEYLPVAIERPAYRSAGQNQLRLSTSNFEYALRLLRNPTVQEASRELNLRLMRKGATVNSRYHCFDLADLLM